MSTTTTTTTAPLSKSSPVASRPATEHVVEPAAFGKRKVRPLFEAHIVKRAMGDAFRKLNPRHQVRNPVMFVVEVGSVLTSALFVLALAGSVPENPWFVFAVSLWLWFTVLFANFAEAMAEGRGKAQADSLRSARKDIQAKQLSAPRCDATVTLVSGARLARATTCSSKPVTRSRATAKSWKASRPSTKVPSRAKAHRSFARAAAIEAP